MKMSKKLIVIALSVLTVVGAFLTAYASNNLFNDISNFGNSYHSPFIVSFPSVTLAAMVLAWFFYILRSYKNPQYFKAMTKLYLIILTVLNSIGVLTTILSAVLVYGSFTSPYPFPGFAIIFLILHILFLLSDVYALVFCLKKVPEDSEKRKMNAKYVFSTIGWVLFTGLVFNRLGTLFMSPMYIQWRTFYMTFPAYIFLVMGLCIGVFKLLRDLEILTCKKALIITASVLLGVTVALAVITMVLGLTDTTFISALSVVYPLERLASKPVELPIHFASYVAVLVILLVQTLKKKEA